MFVATDRTISVHSYSDKEVKMRHSFQQQLCDALAILQAHYAKYFSIEKEIYGEDDDSIARKFERLRSELDEQATTIQSLEEELQEYKDREKPCFAFPSKDEMDSFLIFQFSDRDIETQLLKQEICEFKEQMASLTERYTRLQETMKRREKEHTDLETEMQRIRERKEKDMKTMQKLLTTQEILKLELEREKQRVLSKARDLKEAHDTLAKLTEAQDDTMLKVPSVDEEKSDKRKRRLKGKAAKEAAAREAGAQAAAAKVATIKEAIAKEAKEKELLLESDKAEVEKDRATERKEFQDEITRLKKAEEQAKLHAQRLQQELYHTSRSWQMKFEILKKSLHAIKDEMFLRQSLRQSTKFRRTSLTERNTLPALSQNPPSKKNTFLTGLYMQYPPLPEIKSQRVTGTNEEGSSDSNKIPVTIEIPSAFEGESAEEEDFEESSSLPSPLSSTL
ncbi:uncharacterized protein C10orf67 homolog, mitochondrial [Sceloporus undulatus]|uniref:uncharacterized protein C10orf67 homolog, mitochondrial n=1 Tax=Sceloporus undulatus TaxID=8520 RepID=UPI001C4BE841|nr:uncharacterized protein C10orf67 homolog, mitochondrial [Sceloporus undulatus]